MGARVCQTMRTSELHSGLEVRIVQFSRMLQRLELLKCEAAPEFTGRGRDRVGDQIGSTESGRNGSGRATNWLMGSNPGLSTNNWAMWDYSFCDDCICNIYATKPICIHTFLFLFFWDFMVEKKENWLWRFRAIKSSYL